MTTAVPFNEIAGLERQAQVLADLYKPPYGENEEGFEPHGGHRLLLNDVFVKKVERLLYVNARNWGKTEGAIHVAGRLSLTREHVHPNYPSDQILASYYVAPTKTLAREIIYSTGRIQRCVPKQYIFDITSSPEKAIWFTLDQVSPCGVLYIYGTEDIYNLIGVKHAGLVCVDEFAFTKEGWHKAKEQDFKAWNPLVMLFTTWPKIAPHFIDSMVERYQNTPGYVFRRRPQQDNYFLERNNPGHFAKDRADYERRGETIEYRRDVLSERVVGGLEFIFPTFSQETYREACRRGVQDHQTLQITKPAEYQATMAETKETEHVWPDDAIWQWVGQDLRACQKIVHFDPGHSSVFAVNFDMVNPYTKQYFRVREFYLRKIEDLSARAIMERVINMILKIWGPAPQNLHLGYDEAEKWFEVEGMAVRKEIWGKSPYPQDVDFFTKAKQVFGERGWNLVPTSKKRSPESSRITTIRDMLSFHQLIFSDTCPFSIWEFANFRLAENGDFPDKHNHTIDNLRYGLDLVNYTLECEERPRKVDERVAMHVESKKKFCNRHAQAWPEAEAWD